MADKIKLNISNYNLDDVYTMTIKVSEIVNIFIEYDDENDPYIAIDLNKDSNCNHIYLNDNDDIIPTYFNILKCIQSVMNSGKKHDEYIVIYDKNIYLLSEIEIIN